MYSLVACQIGNPETAYPFFMKSAGVDLKHGGKEWAGLVYIGGTHPASEGGAWMVAVNGFAGISTDGGNRYDSIAVRVLMSLLGVASTFMKKYKKQPNGKEVD